MHLYTTFIMMKSCPWTELQAKFHRTAVEGIDDSVHVESMNGEIDLLLSGIIHNHDSLRVIVTYNSQPYYIVTNPGNKEVLDGLNMALERILDANPNFAAERYAANFPARLVNVQFSDRDLEYVKKRKTITVAVPENW